MAKAVKPHYSQREATPADILVGQKIRTRRIMAGMSQEALGAELGVTFQQVQKYEKGVNRVSATRLQVIANLFKEEIGFFISDGKSHRPLSEAALEINTFCATKEGQRLIKAFSQLPHAGVRHKLILLAEQMAGINDE